MTAAARPWATTACVACLALMIVAPPLNPLHLAPIPSFVEEWLALASGTAAVALALWARGMRIGAVPRVVPWLVAFAALLAVQALVRDLPYREQALLPALYVLWAAAIAWTGFSLREDLGPERAARALAACVLAAACASALIALVQWWDVRSPLDALIARAPSARPYANLGQANLLADLLVLGAASAVFLRAEGALRRVPAAAALALLGIALALTGSRSGFVFALWLLGWATWWSREAPADASRRAARAAALFLAVAVLMQLALLIFGASTASAPATRAVALGALDPAPSTMAARAYLWREALGMFAQAPLFGVGPGMFSWHLFLDAPGFHGMRIPGAERYAHDLPLQLLAETGIAGAALVIAPLVSWFWSNRAPRSEAWRWWAVAFAGVVTLHSLVENPLWYAHFLGPCALVLGLADRGRAVKTERVLRIAAPALVAAGVLPLIGAAAGYRDAIAWLQGRPGATLATMQRSVLRPYAEIVASPVLLAGAPADAEAIAFSERLVRFMPIDLAVYRHIRLLAQAGRAPEARTLLERALVLYPESLGELRRELASARGSPVADELLRRVDARVGK